MRGFTCVLRILFGVVIAALAGAITPSSGDPQVQPLGVFDLALVAPVNGTLPPAAGRETGRPRAAGPRTRVAPGAPYRSSVVYLDLLDANGGMSFCTGVIVGDGVVLTAAHCAVGLPGAPAIRTIRVVPGKEGNAEPWGSQYATSSAAPRAWEDLPLAEAVKYDFGLVFLPDSSLTDRAGIFPGALNPLGDSELLDRQLNPVLAGYPADCNAWTCRDGAGITQDPYGTYQWTVSVPAVDAVDQHFVYDAIDSSHGESGAPVFRSTDGAIVGVHSRTSPGRSLELRLTASVVTWVAAACREHAGCSIPLLGD